MVTELASRLRAAREARGLSVERAFHLVLGLLPEDQWISQQTFRRMEKTPGNHANPVIVLACARVYDVPLEQLSPELADMFEGLNRGPDVGGHDSRWIPILAGQSVGHSG